MRNCWTRAMVMVTAIAMAMISTMGDARCSVVASATAIITLSTGVMHHASSFVFQSAWVNRSRGFSQFVDNGVPQMCALVHVHVPAQGCWTVFVVPSERYIFAFLCVSRAAPCRSPFVARPSTFTYPRMPALRRRPLPFEFRCPSILSPRRCTLPPTRRPVHPAALLRPA